MYQLPHPHLAALALAGLALAAPISSGAAQRPAPVDSAADSVRAETPAARPWHERVSLRGYTQVRYNRLFENNESLVCPQCDRSLGRNGGIFLRRARVSIVAQPSDRVQLVVQPDFTAEASETNGGIAQVRDAYAELALDAAHTTRLRLGQTNVPFGFENLLSSARRAPFDRADALNSAAPTERDLGAFLFWSPRVARARYLALAAGAGKGTGDFGVVAFGAYNGQTANRPEQGGNLHTALRLAYPFAVGGGQVVEAAVQGYRGRYIVVASQRTAGTGGSAEFRDRRAAASLVLHPRPVGLQAEWTIGVGPEADPDARTISERHLQGGYVQAMVRTQLGGHALTPYVRAQRYDGGKKFELDARGYRVREIEAGTEWALTSDLEFTAAYMAATRTTRDLASPNNRQQGHRARLQAQFSF
jgi:hypothetical protein